MGFWTGEVVGRGWRVVSGARGLIVGGGVVVRGGGGGVVGKGQIGSRIPPQVV